MQAKLTRLVFEKGKKKEEILEQRRIEAECKVYSNFSIFTRHFYFYLFYWAGAFNLAQIVVIFSPAEILTNPLCVLQAFQKSE